MTRGDGDALEFTGERFTPECVREIFYEHWHRYAWARSLVAGRDVLDCACGEGYGSRLLAESARSVTGVDVDAATIEHARKRYGAETIRFVASDALDLPFDDDAFGAVVSFETLEHLAEHDALLSEFRRVLRPDGLLLLSSPDKRTYSDETGHVNEFHVRELYRDELEELLGRHFPNFRLVGQKLAFQSLLWPLDDGDAGATILTADDDGDVHASRRPAADPVYYIAVAAAEGADLPELPGLSAFSDRAESVYAHYDEEVRKHIRAGHLLAERDAEIERLRCELDRLARDEAGTATASRPGWWARIRRRLARRR